MEISKNFGKIIVTGETEPTAEEFKKKQAEIYEKLRSITPDELAEFRGREVDAGRAGDIKSAWEKELWRKDILGWSPEGKVS
ncbi:MAG TPA: hypothetical protein VIS99_05620 [Terrimicrobiaceae bacterium]